MNNKKPAMKKSPVKKNSVGKKVVIAQDNNESAPVKKIPSVFVKKNSDNIPSNDASANGTLMADAPNIKKYLDTNIYPSSQQGSEMTLDEYLKAKQVAVSKLGEKIGMNVNNINKNNDTQQNELLKISPPASPKMSPKTSPKIPKNVEFKGNLPVLPHFSEFEEMVDTCDGIIDEEFEIHNVEGTAPIGASGPPPDEMDIDTEEDNFPDQVQIEEYNKEDIEQDKSMYINGIMYEDYKKLPHHKQVNSVQCSYCQKFYNNTQQPKMFTTEFSEGEPVCFHCIFWMNYDIASRPHVDGVYGMTIVEYVMECKDLHDKATCTRNSDAGGCLLCDYLNGVPIDNVLGADVLINEMPEPVPLEDDKEYLQTVDCSFVITI